MKPASSVADKHASTLSSPRFSFHEDDAVDDPPNHLSMACVIRQTLGVRTLLVVINKMDDPTVRYRHTAIIASFVTDAPHKVMWAPERFQECKEKLSPFLKACCLCTCLENRRAVMKSRPHGTQTCGYNVKKDVVFLPISALTAANVVKPYEACPLAACIPGLCLRPP